MLRTLGDINFIREVETAILVHCKEINEITYLEHGQGNIIALVNRRFVFRFPQNEAAAKRTVYETALLQTIKGKLSVIPVPEFIQVHTHPLYTVATYIPGNHLSAAEIKQLPEEDQRLLGQALAEFAVQIHQAIGASEVKRLRTESGVVLLENPSAARFQRIFQGQPLPNAKLSPVVEQYYESWKNYVAADREVFTIHEALRPEALLFNQRKLAGIIDFGHIGQGSLAFEFHGLYAMGEPVLQSAIEHFETLTGRTISYDYVRTWAVMQELATFVELLADQQTETDSFKQAESRLRAWVSGFPF